MIQEQTYISEFVQYFYIKMNSIVIGGYQSNVFNVAQNIQNRIQAHQYVDKLKEHDIYTDEAKKIYQHYNCFRPNSTEPHQIQNWLINDAVAYYFLQLLYCETFEKQERLTNFENKLFICRLRDMPNQLQFVDEICKEMDIEYEVTSEQIQQLLHKEILQNDFLKQQQYFAVSFEKIQYLSLFDCNLIGGKMHLQKYQLLENAILSFKPRLLEQLKSEYTRSIYQQSLHDVQMVMIFHDVRPYIQQQKDVDIQNKPYNVESFPPCMYQIYCKLKNTHHLSYYERRQLLIFYKSIGVTFEETYNIFQQLFKLNTHEFQSKYKYEISYIYGLKGPKANYKTQNCSVLINQLYQNNSITGCFFKNISLTNLKQSLTTYKISEIALNQIEQLYRHKQFQHCCQLIYNLTQTKQIQELMNPLQYYFYSDQSLELKNSLLDRTKENEQLQQVEDW